MPCAPATRIGVAAMRQADLLYLVKTTITQDENGYPVPTETERMVFAERKSATRAEFYAASAAGISISHVFRMHAAEYEGETVVKYDGRRYAVVRAYQPSVYFVELSVSDESVPQGNRPEQTEVTTNGEV